MQRVWWRYKVPVSDVCFLNVCPSSTERIRTQLHGVACPHFAAAVVEPYYAVVCVHFLLEHTEFLDWANGEKRPFTSTLSITCSTLPACKIHWPHVRALHVERVRRFGRRGRGPLLCAYTLRLFVYDPQALGSQGSNGAVSVYSL